MRCDLRAGFREVHPSSVAQVLGALCGICAHLEGPPFSNFTCPRVSTTHAHGSRDHPNSALAVTLQACTAQASAFRPVRDCKQHVHAICSQVPLRRAPHPLTDRPLTWATDRTSPRTPPSRCFGSFWFRYSLSFGVVTAGFSNYWNEQIETGSRPRGRGRVTSPFLSRFRGPDLTPILRAGTPKFHYVTLSIESRESRSQKSLSRMRYMHPCKTRENYSKPN